MPFSRSFRHTRGMARRILCLVLLLLPLTARAQPELVPHQLPTAHGKPVTLSLPRGFGINVALSGLHRVRFFAKAPDGRLFVTDMYDRSDNSRGTVYILDGWNAQRHTYARAIPYLQHLRNPNNLAFYTDASGQSWLYLPLTDRLLRFRYKAGDTAPTSAPEVLAHYPDYGLNYKYGGWHLTRTVAFGKLASAGGRLEDKLFVSVGSSCNACEEKEPIRATLSVMDPDGKNQHIVAKNLRNAVGLDWDTARSVLYATGMGDDQLGDHAPEDPFFAISAAQIAKSLSSGKPIDYGWPYCYFENGVIHPDPHFGALPKANCKAVPPAYTTFPAHSSPLGLERFPATDPLLGNSFLVALHGAGHPRIGTGYKVVRFSAMSNDMLSYLSSFLGQQVSEQDLKPGFMKTEHTDFLTGFFERDGDQAHVLGRPCGIYRTGPDSFLLTDDIQGIIYAVYPAMGRHSGSGMQ